MVSTETNRQTNLSNHCSQIDLESLRHLFSHSHIRRGARFCSELCATGSSIPRFVQGIKTKQSHGGRVAKASVQGEHSGLGPTVDANPRTSPALGKKNIFKKSDFVLADSSRMCAGEYLDVMVEAGCEKQSVLDRLDKKRSGD